MTSVELIGVPFDGYGRAGHQASAATVLREAGLAAAFAGHEITDRGDLQLPAPDPARGARTSLVNEGALVAMIGEVRSRVSDALRAGRFPVVFGGDCTTLLGSVPALRGERPGSALFFVDGHEDTMPLDVSEDGEAANCEIGLLLGLTGRTLHPPLVEPGSMLGRDDLVMLGMRDEAWRRRFNVGSLRDGGVLCRTADEVAAAPAAEAVTAVEHLRRPNRTWWYHVDLDVLDPSHLAAQGVPGDPGEPGGLTWDQLDALTGAALGAGGCVGLSVAIYDPDQDASRTDARRIVEWFRNVAQPRDDAREA